MANNERAARRGRAVPRRWQRLMMESPAVADAYTALRQACDTAGPLDAELVALIKVAVSVGAHDPSTTHMHAKKALAAGVDAEAIRQVALVALPTIGLPAGLDAVTWIDESVAEVAADAASAASTAPRASRKRTTARAWRRTGSARPARTG